MGVHTGLLRLSTDGDGEVVDITPGVAQVVPGTWQQVVLIDLDTRPRNRTVTVQVAS